MDFVLFKSYKLLVEKVLSCKASIIYRQEPLMTISKRLSNRERLLETLRTLSAELDYETVLQSVISVASKLTGSEVASILKYDEADEHLHFVRGDQTAVGPGLDRPLSGGKRRRKRS